MEHVTPLKAGLKWAIYLSIFNIATTMIAHYTGFSDLSNPDGKNDVIMSVFSLVVAIIFTVLAQRYFKGNNEGSMTFGEGMGVATFLGIFSGIIGAIFMYIFMTYVVPEFADVIAETAMSEMTDEEAEAAGEIMSTLMSPTFFAFMSFFGSLIMHVIVGLVCSAILKSDE